MQVEELFHSLLDQLPDPMLGINGLLNLLTWVKHRQLAQASQHEEGGVPCPISYPTRLPSHIKSLRRKEEMGTPHAPSGGLSGPLNPRIYDHSSTGFDIRCRFCLCAPFRSG
jgi:hypothetical protein